MCSFFYLLQQIEAIPEIRRFFGIAAAIKYIMDLFVNNQTVTAHLAHQLGELEVF